MTVTGHVDEVVEKALLAAERSEKKRDHIRDKITQHNAVVAAETAPSMRGVPFAHVPPLGYRTDAQAPLFPLEREALLENVDLNLLAQTVSLPGFQMVEPDNGFEIYIDQQRHVKMRAADAHQLALDGVNVNITTDDLVRWLNREVRQPDIVQSHLLAYLRAMVNYLTNSRGSPQRAGADVLCAGETHRCANRRHARGCGRSAGSSNWVLDGGWKSSQTGRIR